VAENKRTAMAGRIIAIGDIHGCSQALDALIEAISPAPADVLVPLGDYLNRGPDGPGVLDHLIALSRRCQLIPLLGNHEAMLLSALDLAVGAGCLAAASDALPARHLEFLQGCRTFYETTGHLLVHANYLPHPPLADQPRRYLLWEHLDTALAQPHRSGKTAVVGHTPQKDGEVLDLGFLKCIDTFCYGGGWPTALEVHTGRVWQANLAGHLRREAARGC
jgi:serine/threonine protein phosphatase 1